MRRSRIEGNIATSNTNTVCPAAKSHGSQIQYRPTAMDPLPITISKAANSRLLPCSTSLGRFIARGSHARSSDAHRQSRMSGFRDLAAQAGDRDLLGEIFDRRSEG